MKLCSVVLVAVSLAFICVNGQKASSLVPLIKQCGRPSNMDVDAMKKSLDKHNADGKMSCPVECVCKALGIMNRDGGPNEDVIQQLIAPFPAPLRKVYQSCITSMKAGLPNCQSGANLVQCVMRKLVELKRKQGSILAN